MPLVIVAALSVRHLVAVEANLAWLRPVRPTLRHARVCLVGMLDVALLAILGF